MRSAVQRLARCFPGLLGGRKKLFTPEIYFFIISGTQDKQTLSTLRSVDVNVKTAGGIISNLSITLWHGVCARRRGKKGKKKLQLLRSHDHRRATQGDDINTHTDMVYYPRGPSETLVLLLL